MSRLPVVWSLAAITAACGTAPGTATFQIPKGARSANVLLVSDGTSAKDAELWSSLRVTPPGAESPVPVRPYALNVRAADGRVRKARALELVTPFADLTPGTWTLEVPKLTVPIDVEVMLPAARADGPATFDLHFVLDTDCISDLDGVQKTLELAASDVSSWLVPEPDLVIGPIRVERQRLGITCDMNAFPLIAPRFDTGKRELTFLVTSGGISIATDTGEETGYIGIASIPAFAAADGGFPFVTGELSVPDAAYPVGILAQTIAHEVGHFLGLRHVVERDGTPDDLDDTQPCADPSDPDHSGTADYWECGLASGNLMFWQSGSPDHQPLSRSQRDIVLRSVFIHAP